MEYEKMVEIPLDEDTKGRKGFGWKTVMWAFGAGFIIAMFMFVIGWNSVARALAKNAEQEPEPEFVSVSTLEEIIEVSELSTFRSVYNGVAEVQGSSGKTDYYVSYNATVDAGMDFDRIAITVDNDAKTVSLILPDVKITDVNVDILSLDYIFLNDKANSSSVTAAAYKACEQDAEKESAEQNQIFETAEQNAENVVKALVEPVIEPHGYSLKIVRAGS